MSPDYDLVILGHTVGGVTVAQQAVHQGLRVALVNQNCPPHLDAYIRYGLSHWSRRDAPWGEAIARIHHSLAQITEQWSPAVLGLAGVDWVAGVGEFCSGAAPTLAVGERRLTARAYLLALGRRPAQGIRLKELLQLDTPPTMVTILGNNLTAVELASSLQRLGVQVMLVEGQALLPQEDPRLVERIGAILAARGVKRLKTPPEETGLLVDCQSHTPPPTALNLAGVGVRAYQNRLLVNCYLQTTQPRIYAIGADLGGYDLPQLERAEGAIALYNSGHHWRKPMDYRTIPITLYTDPPFARVGLTTAQAQREYGPQVRCYQTYLKDTVASALTHRTTGLCRVLALPKGKILGAALLGGCAPEAIALFALALEQGLTLDQLPPHLFPHPSTSETIPTINGKI
ncbi:FAD-dependent oxidoreductase [Spirulina sp. CCNP1310]|uniref:FAD-dependent oxidoreductase n=1 Tax=Spirulina sp. CCNP1310 TaxID=3110249 RepID=UPI002B203CB9|nr:FAD-dependent oxidoreductase [Spirulina sp. CCNP1310]MEA5419663.1 FAD-dependent oxidoreductase [Spirulina sp. CCNP1310]